MLVSFHDLWPVRIVPINLITGTRNQDLKLGRRVMQRALSGLSIPVSRNGKGVEAVCFVRRGVEWSGVGLRSGGVRVVAEDIDGFEGGA